VCLSDDHLSVNVLELLPYLFLAHQGFVAAHPVEEVRSGAFNYLVIIEHWREFQFFEFITNSPRSLINFEVG